MSAQHKHTTLGSKRSRVEIGNKRLGLCVCDSKTDTQTVSCSMQLLACHCCEGLTVMWCKVKVWYVRRVTGVMHIHMASIPSMQDTTDPCFVPIQGELLTQNLSSEPSE